MRVEKNECFFEKYFPLMRNRLKQERKGRIELIFLLIDENKKRD
jgi:hypothetical protein